MTHYLDPQGYEQTKRKLAELEGRQAEIAARTDLSPPHREQVLLSYREMMRQYRREMKLHEAMQKDATRGV
jgi:hypothetical protein